MKSTYMGVGKTTEFEKGLYRSTGMNLEQITDSLVLGGGPLGRVMAILGDSITDQNVIGDSTGGRGYMTWANIIMGKPFTAVLENGVGGDRTDQILDRVDDVINASPKPSWCTVLGGTNDLGQFYSVDHITTNLVKIYDKLKLAGITPVACTVPPNDAFDDTVLARLGSVNDYLRNYCNHNDIAIVDFNKYLSTYENKYRNGFNVDTTHPSQLGASYMGRAWSDAMSSQIQSQSSLITSNTDTNVITNGMLAGDNSGLADGWNLYNSGAASKVPDELLGFDWQKVTASGITTLANLNTDIGVAWDIGDEIYAEIAFETDSDFVGVGQLTLELLINTSEGDVLIADNLIEGANKTAFLDPKSGILRTPPIVIPAGATRLQHRTVIDATGGIRLSSAAIKKV